MQAFESEEELWGELFPYIRDEEITDINWNGAQLWVDHLKRGRYRIPGMVLQESYLNRLAARLSDAVNVSFNPYCPLLEAESEDLRVSIIHEAAAVTGKSLSIRKTPAVRRLNKEKMIREKYCSREMEDFMEAAVKAGCTVIAAGLPGAGKTEYIKALTAYIPPQDKVITIEDTLEIHYRAINPEKDCVELKVSDRFTYPQAIKACMRQLPKWILLSEARSVEVEYLLESMSTGTHCLTTIHTDDVRKIPDRICNMIKKDVINDVFSFVDIGVLVRASAAPDGRVHRTLQQICAFSRYQGENRICMIFEDGRRLAEELPEDLKSKFRYAGIPIPLRQKEEEG